MDTAKIDIAGLKVNAITKKQLLDEALGRIKTGRKTFITTPYSEFLYHAFKEPKLLEIFNQADFAVADGIGIFWAKRYLDIPLTAKNYWLMILQALWQIIYSLAAIIFYPRWIKSALPEKIVGADLIWDLAKLASDNNLSMYLLGGHGNTPELAKQQLISKFPNLLISASNKNPEDATVYDDLKKASPDLLFVAYGPMKQEAWIAQNLSNLPVKLAIGVGGTFDYLAGKRLNPPKFLRYAGLEWLWRLGTQPHRFKRIINATFGLMSGLWHYKVFNSMPLRPNVVVIIINHKNQILICQRKRRNPKIDIVGSLSLNKFENYWQLPQGGIDKGEDVIAGAKREAWEETGLKNLQFIKLSETQHTYIWNNALRKFFFNTHFAYKGQSQHIAYFKTNDDGEKINLNVSNIEFINSKWVSPEEAEIIVHEERQALVKIAKKDLKEIQEKAII